jgi:iron complex outermembrane receptor protein
VDIVGSTDFLLGEGESKITVAFNYNKTEVDDRGTINPISDGRVEALEDLLPSVKGNVAWSHLQGSFRTLVRANYYGSWRSTGNGYNVGSQTLIDAQVTYYLDENLEFTLGVDNLFDDYPDENPGAGSTGQLYPEDSPFGFNGGTWYLRGRYAF